MSFINKIGRMLGQQTQPQAVVSVTTSSARSTARDRLSVILASQRGSELLSGVDMNALQQDVLKVVQKHIQVAKDKPVQCQLNSEGEVNLFEMSVELGASGRTPSGPTGVSLEPSRAAV